MNASLSKVSETVTALRLAADKLKVDLDKARTDLQELKANCSGYPSNISSMCTPISTDNLKQEANFSTVPDVNSELGNLNSILSQNFSGAVAQVYNCLMFLLEANNTALDIFVSSGWFV